MKFKGENFGSWEAQWYVRHGRYMDRLCFDSRGWPYIESDATWNRSNPERQEWIETRIENDIGEPYIVAPDTP